MLILLCFPSPEGERLDEGCPSVRYLPELAAFDQSRFADRLRELAPDVLVVERTPPAEALAVWRAARPGVPLVLVHASGTRNMDAPDLGAPPVRDGIARIQTAGVTAALRSAERAWNAAVVASLASLAAPGPRAGPSADRSVALVGAGVVNLVTALELRRHGWAVAVYDRAPDPRGDTHWSAYGCTRGGGDGRMFTLTEADSYNSRSWNPDGTSNELLNRPVTADGWLVAKPGEPLEVERRWAEDFHRVPPWLADSYTDEIFAVNQEAEGRWAELRARRPELFDDNTGYQDGILRLYTEREYFRWHWQRNERLGAVHRVLDPDAIGRDYPALAEACANGTVAGGLEVTGFTVNIHRFVARLVDQLERDGVTFHWGVEVTAVRRDASGWVEGVYTKCGELDAANVVISPGAYGAELLRGTATEGVVQGMLGVWLSVPNIEPMLDHSLKIARKGHRAEETNATLGTGPDGEPLLICGSGYGWTGLNPSNIDSAELDALFDSLTDTLRRFFPRAYAAARGGATLDVSRRYCVRPWTASCLGVFETLPAQRGTVVITGGHNTGGFAQSPVVAEAVLAALEGREHPMHARYHPGRLTRFRRLTGVPSPA